MTEQAIQRAILKHIKSLPDSWVCKTITTNINGVPDILACVGGRFVGLEVKRPGQKPTKLQCYQMQQIRNAGGVATVVTSVDAAKKFLDEVREVG